MRLLVFALMVLPLPAFALSCMPYGVGNAYLEASKASASYLPVRGTLSFDATLLPKSPRSNPSATPAKTLIPARFKGVSLRARGAPVPVETNITLEVRCSGPWCPRPKAGDTLGFLRETSRGYVLSINACGGFLFSAPSKAQMDQVQDCLAERRCAPAARR